ncbi:MAG: 2-phospho-L-lactate guanylyltransferase [Chloroflexi bacterium]|nr:MAG: 2-phospho-L-lactate guanylyltransferase [Chloroflexota bacterium]
MSLWVVIPVKRLPLGKSRLAHLLPTWYRAELMTGFLRRVLGVTRQIPEVDRILVMSSDERVWQVAHEMDVDVLPESGVTGLNTAVSQAVNYAVAHGATSTLILPADLPFVQPSDLLQLIRAGKTAETPSMAICSDTRQDGTNALFLTPPTPFQFQYGPGSFQQHIQEAARHHMHIHIVQAPGLQFDLDTEADWYLYQQMAAPNGHHIKD